MKQGGSSVNPNEHVSYLDAENTETMGFATEVSGTHEIHTLALNCPLQLICAGRFPKALR